MDNSLDLPKITAEALKLLSPLQDVLPQWYKSLRTFAEGGSGERLRVGVIGVTSSGKSTFINALLGEELLPEQSKATTNVPVICRMGPDRKMLVTFLDGSTKKHSGKELNRSLLKSLCSEDGNKQNARGIRNLLIESPTCFLSTGVEIIDTPGVDAVDGQRHEEITLYECVPSLDIVVYMTHIVRPFAESDVKLIRRVLEHDQRVLFVISHKDKEKDDFEKNVLFRSKEQKLQNHINELRKKLARFPELSSAAIVTVSSLHGKLAAGDRYSDAWRESNIDAVLESIRGFEADLSGVITEVRAERLEKILTQFVAAGGKHAPDLESTASIEADAEISLAAELKKLTAARRAVKDRIDTLRAEVSPTLDARTVVAELQSLFSKVSPTDIPGFYSALSTAESQWSYRQSTVTNAIDEARVGCREELDKLGMPAGRSSLKHKFATGEFPSLERRIQSKTETHTVRRSRGGFFGTIADWFDGGREESYNTTTRTVNVSLIKQDLKDYVQSSIDGLSAFVEGQIEMFSELYTRPVEVQVQEQKMLLASRRDMREAAESKKAEFSRVLLRFQKMAALLKVRIRPDSASKGNATSADRPGRAQTSVKSAGDTAPPSGNASGMMSSMLARVREGAALNRFWAMANQIAGEKQRDRMLIAGMDREDAEGFVSYLRRSMRDGRPKWTAEGIEEIPIAHGFGETTVVVVPTDIPIDGKVLRDQCVRADVITLPFDGAQPSAGLKRLLALEHYDLLKRFAQKVLMVIPGAATYDHRLGDLVTEAIVMLGSTAFRAAPCYIFEADRYDARYTDFVEIMRNVLASGGRKTALIRHWSANKLAYRPPFTEAELLNAHDRICGGKERDGQ